MKECFDEAFRAECERIGYPIVRRDTEELLVSLLRTYRPRRILEIGTCVGYSACAILAATPDSALVTVESVEEKWRAAKENFARFGFSERVLAICGDCREVVPALDREFDFVFLDGPKGQYAALYPYVKDLLAPGGVLVADNTDFHGIAGAENVPRRDRTVRKNLREFLAVLREDPDFSSEFSEIGDGVAVGVKK